MCRVNCSILDYGTIWRNFSLQLSLPTQFAKISNKKVIAENQCEKHKNKSLVQLHIVGAFIKCVMDSNH